MTRIIYNNIQFETNGDCSSFQVNLDGFSQNEVNEIKEKLVKMGFPVYEPKIPEPMSIVFSTLAMKTGDNL